MLTRGARARSRTIVIVVAWAAGITARCQAWRRARDDAAQRVADLCGAGRAPGADIVGRMEQGFSALQEGDRPGAVGHVAQVGPVVGVDRLPDRLAADSGVDQIRHGRRP